MTVRFVALDASLALLLACVSIGCVSEVGLGSDEHYRDYFLGDDVTCRVPARRETSDNSSTCRARWMWPSMCILQAQEGS